MALFWCTEALPLAVTALFPVLLFPLMNIMDSTTVCREYLKDTNMLFIGGLLMAIAIENWHLHKRVALRVLLITGVRPALLLMGFMVVTAFLSMWISNTATTAMMVPIAQAVLEQFHKSEIETSTAGQASENINKAFELQEEPTKPDSSKETEMTQVFLNVNLRAGSQKHKNFCKGMSLCICYSASIGGIATLTGTTPNLVLQGQVDELFPKNGHIINFASWFSFAFPTMVVLLVLTWIWLQILYLGFNFRKNFGCAANASAKAKEQRAYDIIKEESKKLGSMKFAEIAVLILFILLVLLWFTRDPGFIPGGFALAKGSEVTFLCLPGICVFLGVLHLPLQACSPRTQEGMLGAPNAHFFSWCL
uniref:Solute carrier family 13 member 2 n=1 Tax=Athene cunicularia TaxID=194338 RepID=A0A663MHY6_ATHCN